MSLKIEINVGADMSDPRGYLNAYMDALGFSRAAAPADPATFLPPPLTGTDQGSIAADAVTGQKVVDAEPAPKKTRAKKEAAPSISTTPEDRKPPEDDAETQEQDAADEAAEVEAARPAAAPLTVEDVMGAVGGYVEKFGLPAAQEDGPNIFVSALGKPPGGEPYWKKSLLATATQDQLQKALVAWKTAAAAGQRFVAKGA